MEDNNPKIVSIEYKARLPIKEEKSPCPHNSVLVHENTRSMECEDCGAEIDPFGFIYKQAIQERALIWDRDYLKREIKNLREEKSRIENQLAYQKKLLRDQTKTNGI